MESIKSAKQDKFSNTYRKQTEIRRCFVVAPGGPLGEHLLRSSTRPSCSWKSSWKVRGGPEHAKVLLWLASPHFLGETNVDERISCTADRIGNGDYDVAICAVFVENKWKESERRVADHEEKGDGGELDRIGLFPSTDLLVELRIDGLFDTLVGLADEHKYLKRWVVTRD